MSLYPDAVDAALQKAADLGVEVTTRMISSGQIDPEAMTLQITCTYEGSIALQRRLDLGPLPEGLTPTTYCTASR